MLRRLAVLVVAGLTVVSCSSGDDADGDLGTSPAEPTAAETVTTLPTAEVTAQGTLTISFPDPDETVIGRTDDTCYTLDLGGFLLSPPSDPSGRVVVSDEAGTTIGVGTVLAGRLQGLEQVGEQYQFECVMEFEAEVDLSTAQFVEFDFSWPYTHYAVHDGPFLPDELRAGPIAAIG